MPVSITGPGPTGLNIINTVAINADWTRVPFFYLSGHWIYRRDDDEIVVRYTGKESPYTAWHYRDGQLIATLTSRDKGKREAIIEWLIAKPEPTEEN